MIYGKFLFLTLAFAFLAQIRCQHADDKLYPDMTCHINYPSEINPKPIPDEDRGYLIADDVSPALQDWFKLDTANADCETTETPGPNLPLIDDPHFGALDVCKKICMLDMLGFLHTGYGKDTMRRKINYTLRDSTEFLNELKNWKDGTGSGPELSAKVYNECAELFNTVLNVENERCYSARAEEAYECINKALKC